MSQSGVFVISMGIISAVGRGISETTDAIKKVARGIKPLRLFSTGHIPPLPVGEIHSVSVTGQIPRTHVLAMIAADEAMKQYAPPDAVIIGVTTGGMPLTEELLKRRETDSERYKHHSTGSVSEYIARHVRCTGPVLTVSTACSSGIVALKIASEMIRRGKANSVLVGGADALCRLTYYGFHSLQLIDSAGARPFDKNRQGMTVGEGAAMLLISAADIPPENAFAELLGIGLSCDAYHSTAPHPEGLGALSAMQGALSDSNITIEDIDYIHLHGTGTIDNDIAEAKAIHALFGDHSLPPVSSMKGSIGHSLAAAGSIGVVTSTLSIATNVIPANGGFHDVDSDLNITPVETPTEANVKVVLANSFGFGGNNASVVVGHPMRHRFNETSCINKPVTFSVLGMSCLTAAGDLKQTLACMNRCEPLNGTVPSSEILKPLTEKAVRRLKRLPRMVLSLAISACKVKQTPVSPGSVFLGTGWGGLSETNDFLAKLFSSDEQFTSPTDFIGSVHNAAAGQVAVHFQSIGPNVTMTGNDCAFEQALLSASLIAKPDDDPLLVIGCDEYHETLTPLFDSSAALIGSSSDGGGALYLKPATAASPLRICSSFLAHAHTNEKIIPDLIRELGGSKRISDSFAVILAGLPAAQRQKGKAQLDEFISTTGYQGLLVDYRRYLGEFASASAVAAVLGISFAQAGEMPGNIFQDHALAFDGRGVLILGFGKFVTAVEILP